MKIIMYSTNVVVLLLTISSREIMRKFRIEKKLKIARVGANSSCTFKTYYLSMVLIIKNRKIQIKNETM